MEILNVSSALLSDFEVFQVLQESKETRHSSIKLAENILTVEFEVPLPCLFFKLFHFSFLGFGILYKSFFSGKVPKFRRFKWTFNLPTTDKID